MLCAALFLDCYGTIVPDDRGAILAVVGGVSERIGIDPVHIDRPWWDRFSALCSVSHGARFQPQFELEVVALGQVLDDLGASLPRAEVESLLEPLVDYWRGSVPCDDAVEFLSTWTSCPVLIVSNIDRADLAPVTRRLPPVAAVVTSEDARAYKPNRLVFGSALARAETTASQTVHVGDSWGSDVLGARAAGIRPVHVVRRAAPGVHVDQDPTVPQISSLLELIPMISV